MSTVKRIPGRYFALLLSSLRSGGVDVAQLLRIAGVDASLFDRLDATLEVVEVDNLIAAARRLTGRTDLGFEAGHLIQMTSHDILGYGMLSCQNLDQVVRLVSRFYHLMNETFTLRYRRSADCGEAIYSPVIAMPLELLHFLQEVLATAHENQVRLMLGGALRPYDIYLSMAPPRHVKRYATLGPVRFHFDERALPGVRVVMDAALMDNPMPMPSPLVVRQVEERCQALTRRPTPDESGWGAFIAMMLRDSAGQTTLDHIAARLSVSARTIDRYLKREKLQFRDLSQQVRFDRACEWLAAGGATVGQVAERLGFSDAANFSRAFRRFVGVSPSQYQQQQPQRPG